MTINAKSFSFPSFRNLKHYLGEADAMVELTELAVRSFVASAQASGNIAAYIEEASEQYEIRVSITEFSRLTRHLAQNYLVMVYQSAELFLHEFRREHTGLFKRDWTGDANDVDSLTLALKNIAVSQHEAEEYVGRDLISRFQYYRVVRNSIVHGKGTDLSKARAKYNEIIDYSNEHRALLKSTPASNYPDALNFDDFITFSRVTKLIAEKISRLSEPNLAHLAKAMSDSNFKHLKNNHRRLHNAVSGKLRTDYGFDNATAEWIVNEIIDSLA